jgi:hypothetical protein
MSDLPDRLCVCGHRYDEHMNTPEVRYCKVCAVTPGPDKCTYFRRERGSNLVTFWWEVAKQWRRR